mgnify:CR=1 FL=1
MVMARRRRRSAQMDKTPVQTQIDNLSHEGSGIARIEGKATFIQGALPGETVTLEFQAPAKGNYEFFCSYPGHADMMKGYLFVK